MFGITSSLSCKHLQVNILVCLCHLCRFIIFERKYRFIRVLGFTLQWLDTVDLAIPNTVPYKDVLNAFSQQF